MDEQNKQPGVEPTPPPSDSASKQSKPAEAQTAGQSPSSRAITSKRIVIPADAKRAPKQQTKPDAETQTGQAQSPAQETTAAAADVIPAADTQPTASDTTPAISQETTFQEQTTTRTDTTAEPAKPSTTDTRTLIPNTLSDTPATTGGTARGITPANMPYLPQETSFAPPEEAPRRGNRILEFALWGIAILLLAATAYFVIPLLFPNLFSNQGTTGVTQPTATVVAVAAATKQPSPTTTLLPTQAATQSAAGAETQEPLIIPTPPPDGEQLSLLPDGNLSGWIVSGQSDINYADSILQAGTSEGKSYASIVQFNLRNLPTDTKLLFAALELTGKDGSKLAGDGEWQIELIENSPGIDWTTTTAEQIEAAKSLGVLGTLKASDLGTGKLNRIFLDEAQLQMLAQQFQNGNAVLRIRGPQGGGENLFVWESGVGGSAINAPTLHMVAIPGNYVVITNTPAPRNVLTAAAHVVRGTDAAKRNGTPTPFPPGVATATPGGEIVEVPFETAVAGNDATAIARAQLATAIARTTGTYTPTPKGAIIIFPTFTPVVISPDELATATAIPPDTNLLDIPIDYDQCNCKGRILLYSNRYGGDKTYPIMIGPDGAEMGKLSGDLYYRLAVAREQYSPDRQRRLIYPNDSRGVQQIGVEDVNTGEITFLTRFPRGVAYDAAWAPDGSAVAFVATEADNSDQLYLYDFGTEQVTLLVKTPGGQPWFKRPTWSPDSQQIAYWSSVSGTPQIWVMNRDGSDQHNISNNAFKEVDPVWVK